VITLTTPRSPTTPYSSPPHLRHHFYSVEIVAVTPGPVPPPPPKPPDRTAIYFDAVPEDHVLAAVEPRNRNRRSECALPTALGEYDAGHLAQDSAEALDLLLLI